MNQPIALSAEMVLNEYHNELAVATGEIIRQRCLISLLEQERNRAWARVEELESQIVRQGHETETFHSSSSPGVWEPAG